MVILALWRGARHSVWVAVQWLWSVAGTQVSVPAWVALVLLLILLVAVGRSLGGPGRTVRMNEIVAPATPDPDPESEPEPLSDLEDAILRYYAKRGGAPLGMGLLLHAVLNNPLRLSAALDGLADRRYLRLERNLAEGKEIWCLTKAGRDFLIERGDV